MTNSLLQHIAPLIGWGIITAYLFLLGLPLLLGLLMACKFVRYRDWLAAAAVVLSMGILAVSGNFIYNLMNWDTSRFSPAMNVISCALIFAAPPFLFVLILVRSRRRWVWGVVLTLVTALALLAMYNEFAERKARDAEAYRQGMKPLSPRTGTALVRWWRDDRQRTPRFFLQGHVLEGTPVVLLTDPFTSAFRPQFCTAVAAAYLPSAKDPAVLGNVTQITSLKDCGQSWMQGLAVLERPVATYRAIPFQPVGGPPDRLLLNHPMVHQEFAKLQYDPANFDFAKGETRKAIGPQQASVFVTSLMPIKNAPNVYPCTGPTLLLSVRELGNVRAVFPYCTLSWNLFAVDDDVYFAAFTQLPTPPSDEPPMNPDQTYWLFRVEVSGLKQLWPES